ncbi:ferredoxin [Subtercola endophyticus]|uniref:ferredoxin n=1 Tax=Subtercola endophyticus TaxID=2895559 RepID=UPI001E5643CF|nr:ferredoxin [Subtercola endophyticus]UFS60133.1 ferredoxin [Subtercola endophyticus]
MAARRLESTSGASRDGTAGRMPVRLHIDWTRCDGRGLCTELLADQLTRDEWGYPLARRADDASNVPIPAAQLDAAHDAVALCPRQALRLVAE